MSEGPGWWSSWSIFVGSFLKTHDEDSDDMGWMTMSISYHVTWPWLIDYVFSRNSWFTFSPGQWFCSQLSSRNLLGFASLFVRHHDDWKHGDLRGSWVFTRKALWNRVFGDLAHWQVEPKRFVGLLLYNPFFGIYLEILQEPKKHIKICVCSPQVEGLSFGINNHDTIIIGVDLVNVAFIFWIG